MAIHEPVARLANRRLWLRLLLLCAALAAGHAASAVRAGYAEVAGAARAVAALASQPARAARGLARAPSPHPPRVLVAALPAQLPFQRRLYLTHRVLRL